MIAINPMFFIDGYKADHRSQYPLGTRLVYSNFTPRKSRMAKVDQVVSFGLQYFIKEYLIEQFNTNFFNREKEDVVREYQELMDNYLGPNKIETDHIAALHDLGYLPLQINALPEGSISPIQTPVLTIWNTLPEFFWLVNYIETLMSGTIWKPYTTATIARQFRLIGEKYAELTGGDREFVKWQFHNFSLRGMSGIEDGCLNDGAHLCFFTGTDTVPSLPWLKHYYGATGLIGGSVPASEHSVNSAYGSEQELSFYNRMITEVYPDGIVSIVSDTYDFWNVVTSILPTLKEKILARNGRLVVRPDSGIPHKIICGDPEASTEPERKGLVQCLWETFDGSTNNKGFKVLDPHIGWIYGDSIDLEEAELILSGLAKNGHVSTTGVFGVGSYTYQYVTRDTLGFAIKATYCEIDGKPVNIFKNPKTGGWKKSHKGLLRVNNDYSVTEEVDWANQGGLLKPVFKDGKLLRETNLQEIRDRIESNLHNLPT